ncbi:MAG: tyrosine-type recombinase/integrase [Dialister sp.]|nr:tyrosine-type recombinase/integrase [Dialister sp.]
MRATRGTGSISEYRKGKFKAIITTGYEINPVTGKKKRLTKTFTGETRQQVLKKLHEFQYKSSIGVINPLSPSTTVLQFMPRWEIIKAAQVKETTLNTQKALLNNTLIKYYGDKAIKDITPSMLNTLFLSLLNEGKESKTVNLIKVIISNFFTWARREKIIAVNPCQDTIKIKANEYSEANNINPLTQEQIKTYLSYLKTASTPYPYTYELIRTALETGARKGELLGLRFSDLDVDKGTISISRTRTQNGITTPKSKASIRTISVGRDLIELLMSIDHTAPDSFVFHKMGAEWTPISIGYPNLLLKETLSKAGLPKCKFHNLRHTNATLLISRGVDIKTVSKRLGHSSVVITLDTYAHFVPETDKAASELIQNICSVE